MKSIIEEKQHWTIPKSKIKDHSGMKHKLRIKCGNGTCQKN
jgi:hypothetical protein